jgi:2-polyprenyl-3-methyl-5-hydroxy-6-metoxy-1,4-benzoquinol methylase
VSLNNPTSDDIYVAGPTLSDMNARLDTSAWPFLDACPICGSVNIVLLAVIRSMPYDRCRTCGFTFTNPYPPDRVLDAFYNGAFYTNYRYLEDRKRTEDPYFSVSMRTDLRRSLARLVASHSPNHVLEYGCGTGTFLALLRDQFGVADVEGFEIGVKARESALRDYDLDVAASPRELKRESYDFVVLLEVIEHIPNPVKIFADIARRVRPGGSILITTPAVDNLLAKFIPSQCAEYTAPSHVSLFTTKAMRLLLDQHNLVPRYFATDPALGVMHGLGRSLFYRLDFVSPQHDNDASDVLLFPTTLGRKVGLQPRRKPPLPVRMMFKGFSVADRVLRSLVAQPGHIYVVAEKRPP